MLQKNRFIIMNNYGVLTRIIVILTLTLSLAWHGNSSTSSTGKPTPTRSDLGSTTLRPTPTQNSLSSTPNVTPINQNVNIPLGTPSSPNSTIPNVTPANAAGIGNTTRNNNPTLPTTPTNAIVLQVTPAQAAATLATTPTAQSNLPTTPSVASATMPQTMPNTMPTTPQGILIPNTTPLAALIPVFPNTNGLINSLPTTFPNLPSTPPALPNTQSTSISPPSAPQTPATAPPTIAFPQTVASTQLIILPQTTSLIALLTTPPNIPSTPSTPVGLTTPTSASTSVVVTSFPTSFPTPASTIPTVLTLPSTQSSAFSTSVTISSTVLIPFTQAPTLPTFPSTIATTPTTLINPITAPLTSFIFLPTTNITSLTTSPLSTTTLFTENSSGSSVSTSGVSSTSLPSSGTTMFRPQNFLLNTQNVILQFCNQYSTSAPTAANLPAYLNILRIQLAYLLMISPNRIIGLSIQPNPDNGQFTIMFGLGQGPDISQMIINLYNTNALIRLSDANADPLTVCPAGPNNVLIYTSNGNCFDAPCQNNGICIGIANGKLVCQCTAWFNGKNCEINLWPLLALLALAVLLPILITLCCCYLGWCPCVCCTCLRRKKKVIQAAIPAACTKISIEDNDSTGSEVALTRKSSLKRPLQTFYLPYHRPLSVGFGTESICGGMCNGGMDMDGGTMRSNWNSTNALNASNPDMYYQTLGQNMALAFNHYTFAPVQRPPSVMFKSQNFDDYYDTMGGGSTQVIGGGGMGMGMGSGGESNSNGNGSGGGYYHALGQKLAITFDGQNN